MKMLRIIPSLLIATLITTFGISLVHSLMVQQGLTDLGIAIPAALRVQTIGRDFIGLAPALGAVTVIGFAIAFTIALVLHPRAPRLLQAIAFPLAGAVAIGAALWLMKLQFDMSPIAGARTPQGQGLMILTGALGGLVFAQGLVLPKKHTISRR